MQIVAGLAISVSFFWHNCCISSAWVYWELWCQARNQTVMQVGHMLFLFSMKLWMYYRSYWVYSSIACIFVLTLFLGLCKIVLVMVANGFTAVACFCFIAVLLVAFFQLCISEQIGWESSIFSVCSCLYLQFMRLENREQLGDSEEISAIFLTLSSFWKAQKIL